MLLKDICCCFPPTPQFPVLTGQVWGLVDAEKREASLVELLTIGSGFWQGAVSSSRGHTGVLIAKRVGQPDSGGGPAAWILC